MKLFSVGQSKVNTWRRCKQEYHFKYVEELQRIRIRRPFMFGTIVHRMIEEHAHGRDPMAILDQISFEHMNLFTAEQEMYSEIVEDCRTIMAEYFQYWQPRDFKLVAVLDETGEERFAEHEFAVPFEEHGIVFKGQVDSLGITPNKLRWLGENKSFDKLPSDDHRWRNLQSVVYIYAVERLGWLKRVDGVCWNYIKSKPPTEPQLLKSGGLSSRDIVTLPSVVMAAIKRHKLNPADYTELIDRAKESRKEYFQRIFTPVNRSVSKNIFDGFIYSAKEMRKYGGTKREKSIGRHCEWCDYEPLCRAEMTGGDVAFVKEREFQREDPEAYRRSGREKKKLPIIKSGSDKLRSGE